MREPVANCKEKAIAVGGLLEKVVGAELRRLDRRLHGSVAGHHDANEPGVDFLHALKQFESVHAGHFHVKKREIRAPLGEHLEPRRSVRRALHVVVFILEHTFERTADRRVVVDNENARLAHENLPSGDGVDTNTPAAEIPAGVDVDELRNLPQTDPGGNDSIGSPSRFDGFIPAARTPSIRGRGPSPFRAECVGPLGMELDPRIRRSGSRDSTPPSAARRIAALLFLLLGMALLDGSLLVRQTELNSILASISLVLSIGFAGFFEGSGGALGRLARIALAAAAAMTAFRAPAILPFAAAALFFAGTGRPVSRTLGWTALGAGMFTWIRDTLGLWSAGLEISRIWTAAITGVKGTAASWGPSYSGLWMFVTFAIAGLAWVRFEIAQNRLRRAAFLLSFLVVALIISWRASTLPSPLHQARFPDIHPIWRLAAFLLLSVALVIPLAWRGGGPLTIESESGPARRRLRALFGVVLAIAGLVLLTPPVRGPDRAPRVLLDRRGAFEMNGPEWGRYGADAPQDASLGNFPALLAAHGIPFAQNDSTLTAERLRDHDELIVMNPEHLFDEAELGAIWDFVRAGGGLLVLADHTNIRETLAPLNALLAPSGIRVLFDCAIPLVERWTWYGCTRALPNPIARGLKDESRLRTSVGASLAVSAPALPILLGSAAFSDPGDSANAQGAYLGNMRNDRGDPLGDIPLVAFQTFGRGRVLVFGDTSPFQRSALVTSRSFVLRSILAVAPGSRAQRPLTARRAGAVLLLLGAGLLVFGSGGSPRASAAFALFACAWIAAQDRFARFDIPPVTTKGTVAWIDLAHGNRVDLHAGKDEGLGGFTDHLERHGLLPLECPRVDASTLAKGALYATIAPAIPFAATEIRALREHVESGGLLVVAAGFEERRGVESLLAEFGLSIGSTPIGSAHESRNVFQDERIYFHESWPILGSGSDAQTWAECWGSPLIVFERRGKGGVLAIGDSRFLTSSMLESTETFVEPNIRFLRAALDSARHSLAGDGA